ncbi:hypothetical protein H9P43_003644 [Blastocladiella emersonii ATCC 22665]|nr:hypothetical protein H9P43_003644 [Blastocladiella emersonii ATCC 22665]
MKGGEEWIRKLAEVNSRRHTPPPPARSLPPGPYISGRVPLHRLPLPHTLAAAAIPSAAPRRRRCTLDPRPPTKWSLPPDRLMLHDDAHPHSHAWLHVTLARPASALSGPRSRVGCRHNHGERTRGDGANSALKLDEVACGLGAAAAKAGATRPRLSASSASR